MDLLSECLYRALRYANIITIVGKVIPFGVENGQQPPIHLLLALEAACSAIDNGPTIRFLGMSFPPASDPLF